MWSLGFFLVIIILLSLFLLSHLGLLITELGFSTPLPRAVQLNLAAQGNMKKKNNSRAGSEKQYGPRLVGEILHDYLENSNEPFARAFREHTAEAEREADQLFVDIHPNTELCIDLKLMTRQPGRMPVGEYLPGMLTRDGEDHFLFIENGDRKRVVAHRNPRIYRGRYINVVRHADGSLVLTFNRPTLNENFTFQDFCREAAGELLAVAGLIEERG